MNTLTRFEHLDYPVEQALARVVTELMDKEGWDLLLSACLTAREIEDGWIRYDVQLARLDEDGKVMGVKGYGIVLSETGRDITAEVFETM